MMAKWSLCTPRKPELLFHWGKKGLIALRGDSVSKICELLLLRRGYVCYMISYFVFVFNRQY